MSLPARVWVFVERRFEEIIAGVSVCVMTVLIFFQVVMRYVFSSPVSWSDEIAVYAMVWSVYLSASWAVRERAHIRVMNLIQMFPGRVSTVMLVFSDFTWFVFAVFLTYQSILLDLSMWRLPFDSPVLGIAQKWPYLSLVFGFGLMSLRLIQVYYRWIRFGESLLEPRDGEVVIHD